MTLLQHILLLFHLCLVKATAEVKATAVDFLFPANDSYVRFDKFRDGLNEILRSVVPPSCNSPKGAVMFTVATGHHSELLVTQFQSMSVFGEDERQCFAARFITVCLDPACFTACNANKLFNCMLLESNVGDLPPSLFQKAAYSYINWLKWPLYRSIMEVTQEMVFIDGDVLVYHWPWRTDLIGIADKHHVDFLFQRERIQLTSVCDDNNINGGFYYFRRTNKVLEFFNFFIQHNRERYRINDITNHLKMYVMDRDAARVVGLKSCGLPTGRVCSWCFERDAICSSKALTSIVTFHANCLGPKDSKLSAMVKQLKVTKTLLRYPNETISDCKQLLKLELRSTQVI